MRSKSSDERFFKDLNKIQSNFKLVSQFNMMPELMKSIGEKFLFLVSHVGSKRSIVTLIAPFSINVKPVIFCFWDCYM